MSASLNMPGGPGKNAGHGMEIAWLAGLYEGEGSLCLQRGNGRWEMVLASTDLDVLDKARRIAGCGEITVGDEPSRAKPHWKTLYKWRVRKTDELLRLMRELRPHLGARRGERVDEMFTWDAAGRPFAGDPEKRAQYNRNRQARRDARTVAGLPRGN
jgi:hypothetical protein